MERNLISQHQTNALKLEALRAYFDFREGRPTAETVADKLGIPVRTVREWLGDNHNGKLLDEIVPLWPNIGSARQFASDHVPEALQVMAELMRSAKSEKVRLDATSTLLALAGVRSPQDASEEKPPEPTAAAGCALEPVPRRWRGQADPGDRGPGARGGRAGAVGRRSGEGAGGTGFRRVGRGFGTGFREQQVGSGTWLRASQRAVRKEERLGFAGAFLFPVQEWPLHVCWIGRQCERHVEPPICAKSESSSLNLTQIIYCMDNCRVQWTHIRWAASHAANSALTRHGSELDRLGLGNGPDELALRHAM